MPVKQQHDPKSPVSASHSSSSEGVLLDLCHAYRGLDIEVNNIFRQESPSFPYQPYVVPTGIGDSVILEQPRTYNTNKVDCVSDGTSPWLLSS